MVDIHHHLLHGLDDGSSSLERSVEMARLAVEDGITHVVCTPHSNYEFTYEPEKIAEKLAELREALQEAGIALQLGVGCDFHISFENLEIARKDKHRFSINGGRYLLIELPDLSIPRNMVDLSYELQSLGLTPILTHPERNPTLQRDLDRMKTWIDGGMLVQVTADSITGSMGSTAKKVAQTLLERQWVHFIASDAHNVSSRPPRMRAAAEQVATQFGEAYARRLTVENPLAVFNNELIFQELPRYEDEFASTPVPWWRKLLGRQPAPR